MGGIPRTCTHIIKCNASLLSFWVITIKTGKNKCSFMSLHASVIGVQIKNYYSNMFTVKFPYFYRFPIVTLDIDKAIQDIIHISLFRFLTSRKSGYYMFLQKRPVTLVERESWVSVTFLEYFISQIAAGEKFLR